ncbi:YrhC family protein [Metabacillus herbersteinensis]|uniref:YrhC family protein n=1 Tax=Metabacillus herbersteinensis TaxID=283816 RepID=A0ABV6G9E5_9BACI
MDEKKLRPLMIDFKRYAHALLAVSVFLYIGVLIPEQGQDSSIKDLVLMVTTLVFLIGSFTCFKISLKYKKQLDKL